MNTTPSTERSGDTNHDPTRGVREHVAHAIAQADLTDTTVTVVTDPPSVRVYVPDPVRRYSLAMVVTDGTPLVREVIHTSGHPDELLTGASRFDDTVPVTLIGPAPRRHL